MRSLLIWLLTACGAAQSPPAAPRIEAYGGPIVDVHAHLFDADTNAQYAPGTPPGAAYLRELDRRAGVTRSGLIVIAPAGDLAATRKLNDEVIEAALASGGHYFAIGSVHPIDGEAALAELTWIAAASVQVVKLHPNTQRFDVGAPEVAAVVARASELGMVVLFDGFSPFDANQTGKFALLAIKNRYATDRDRPPRRTNVR